MTQCFGHFSIVRTNSCDKAGSKKRRPWFARPSAKLASRAVSRFKPP